MRRITFRSRTALVIGGTLVAAILVAEGAVLLLRPRGEAIEPLAVAATDYFEPAQIERAEGFRDGQRALGLATVAVSGAVLLALALGRPRAARRALERLGERPVLGPIAAGAGLSVAVAVAGLPLAAIAHERAVDVGISTQGFVEWLADEGKGVAIAAVLTGAGAAILLALVRRLPRGWWTVAAGGVVAYAIVSQALAPVLLAPLFNDFDRLPEGPAREQVLDLAARADVDVGEVYEVDASRRSTALNAYVSGLGPTKRVVVYDNLLAGVEQEVAGGGRPLSVGALRSVLAHELAHARNDDIWRGIAFVAIVAPLGMLCVGRGGTALARRGDADPGSPAALPAYGLAIGVVSLVLGVTGAQLSRDVEAEADAFALRLTDDPAALIDLQTRLAERNLADPDPPGWSQALFGTHPTTLERIGAAEAYEAGRRSP